MAIPEKISAIILAAGSSSRLGQSKQLVKIDGTPLLVKTITTTLEINFKEVVVVLGSDYSIHEALINHLPVRIVANENWQTGMGSSVKTGLKSLLNIQPDTSAVMILVCDQPYLSSGHLKALITSYINSNKPLVASRYNSNTGVPALFDKQLFSELLQIDDRQGAKPLLQKFQHVMVQVEWPEGKFDIDTPDDLKQLKS